MLVDEQFTNLLCDLGVQTMPRLLATTDATPQAKSYGQSILDFMIVWAFVSRLMANPQIAGHINTVWRAFPTEMKMTYLSVLTKGPLVRLPTALGFAGVGDAT